MVSVPNILEATDEGTVDDGFANRLDVVGEVVASNATGLQTFKLENSVSVESVAEFLLPTDRESNPNL